MKRNFSLHIPKETKEILKLLAKASNMTLSKYIESVLNKAIQQGNN